MAYRIKHTPSGLYYQPHKHGESNISKKGKIYHTEGNATSSLSQNGFAPSIQVKKGGVVHKLTIDLLDYKEVKWTYGQVIARTKKEDWIIEKLN
jgi:hypothetical protein